MFVKIEGMSEGTYFKVTNPEFVSIEGGYYSYRDYRPYDVTNGKLNGFFGFAEMQQEGRVRSLYPSNKTPLDYMPLIIGSEGLEEE